MTKCIFCGGKAALLCDHPLGLERMRAQLASDAPNLREGPCCEVPARYRVYHTCDASLCRACSVRAGSTHYHLRGGRGFFDTTDYCPGHEQAWLSNRRRELAPGQADSLRFAWLRAVKKSQAPPESQLGLNF